MDKKSIDFCSIHEIIPQKILFQLFFQSHRMISQSIRFYFDEFLPKYIALKLFNFRFTTLQERNL